MMTPATSGLGSREGRVSFSKGTPMPQRQTSPAKQAPNRTPLATPRGNNDHGEEGAGGGAVDVGDDQAMAGLGRLRASLLDSLRAERSKLERERALLGR